MRIVGIDSLWGRTIFFLSRKEVSYSVKFILRECVIIIATCNFYLIFAIKFDQVNKNLYFYLALDIFYTRELQRFEQFRNRIAMVADGMRFT